MDESKKKDRYEDAKKFVRYSELKRLIIKDLSDIQKEQRCIQ